MVGSGSLANPRPSNIGTGSDLPDDVYRIARLERNNIVAWTSVDREHNLAVDDAMWWETFWFFLVLPCFLPCVLGWKKSTEGTIYNTYWVLTYSELKIIIKSYDGCCGRVGEKTKSIPLDSISDCGINGPSTGTCFGGLNTNVPIIYVDTASSGRTESGPHHEAIGYGLSGYEWFASEISSRRDLLKGHHYQLHGHLPQCQKGHLPQAEAMQDRGNGESVESRLQTIGDLRTRGIISDAEHETQRREIIASV